MGWVMLAGIGAVIVGALVALGVPRLVWTSVGAALMLAATGYAVQGSPTLPESPAKPAAAAVAIQPEEFKLRDEMFGSYHNGTAYLGAADAMMSAGEPRTAARAALGGVQEHPDNAALWTELGTALALSDGGTVSPAAGFAFDQAIRLSPAHPAPHYFLGLALIMSGRVQGGREQWIEAYRLAPANAAFRVTLAERLQRLDQFLQAGGTARPPQQ